jgi:hypothetical protein
MMEIADRANMKKRTVSGFEREWAKDNRGRSLPYALVDGDFQSSYFFELINEFRRALKARVTLTLAMGLLCAIEQAGRGVLRYRQPDRDWFENRKCFDEFLQKYMGYRKIASNRYDIFRNGIVHGGLPESKNGTGVGLSTTDYYLSRRKIKKLRGIHIHRNGDCDVTLSVLIKEFEEGVRKFRWHELRYNWSRTE